MPDLSEIGPKTYSAPSAVILIGVYNDHKYFCLEYYQYANYCSPSSMIL